MTHTGRIRASALRLPGDGAKYQVKWDAALKGPACWEEAATVHSVMF